MFRRRVPSRRAARLEPLAQRGRGAAGEAVVGSAPATNASGEAVPQSSNIAFCGDPVAMCTGEEILALVDFELPGLFPLQFKRTYRSSQCDENLGLGFGWRSNFHLHIIMIFFSFTGLFY